MTLFCLALLIAPVVASQIGGNYWVRVIDFALLYIMLALGLNIVVGYTGLLDMGFIALRGRCLSGRPACLPAPVRDIPDPHRLVPGGAAPPGC